MGETTGTAPERVARGVADLVGDGCIVRVADHAHGVMRVAAVAHRDSRRRQQLSELLAAPEPALSAGWPGQALNKNLAFRLEHAAAVEAAGGEAHAGEVYAAVIAPLRQDGEPIGAVVALRDSVELPYTQREQQLIEELALGEPGASAPVASLPAPDRVLEHAAAGVWTTDLQGATTYVNEAASALVGVPACELVGAPLAAFIDEEPQVIYARLSPSTERRDHRLLRSDGTELWVSMTSTPLSDALGRRVGTVSTLSEISERKRVETELRLRAATQDAVRELAEKALRGEALEQLMRGAASTAADILGAEYATVAEVAPARADLVPRFVVGWDRTLIGRRVPILANSLPELCLGDDEPVVGDYETTEALARGVMAEAANARSGVCVSIGGGSGVLAVASPRGDAFRGQDVSFMRWIAAILASRWEMAPAPPAAVGPNGGRPAAVPA